MGPLITTSHDFFSPTIHSRSRFQVNWMVEKSSDRFAGLAHSAYGLARGGRETRARGLEKLHSQPTFEANVSLAPICPSHKRINFNILPGSLFFPTLPQVSPLSRETRLFLQLIPAENPCTSIVNHRRSPSKVPTQTHAPPASTSPLLSNTQARLWKSIGKIERWASDKESALISHTVQE